MASFDLVVWKLSRSSLDRKVFLKKLLTLQSSLRGSTKQQYRRVWKTFSGRCDRMNINPYVDFVSYVLSFLQYLLNKGLKPSSLMVYRPALSRFHNGHDGRHLNYSRTICRFMCGAINLHPPCRTLVPTWDFRLTLNYLQGPPFQPLGEAILR